MARVVNLPSHATSCDFHPFLHSLLLGKFIIYMIHAYAHTDTTVVIPTRTSCCYTAGLVTGQALLWSLPNRDCLLELRCDSKILRPTPINRIVWSPEGNWFGASRCTMCHSVHNLDAESDLIALAR